MAYTVKKNYTVKKKKNVKAKKPAKSQSRSHLITNFSKSFSSTPMQHKSEQQNTCACHVSLGVGRNVRRDMLAKRLSFFVLPCQLCVMVVFFVFLP